MDKFGVFNLLNSLIGVYEKSKSQNSAASPTENSQPSATYSEPSAEKTKPNRENPVAVPPLQRSMIKTLDSHDAFIERVKNRNAAKKT